MTFGECLVKVRKLINYYSIAGSVVAEGDETGRDYSARAAAAIDSAQKELAGLCPLIKHLLFEQLPLRPKAVRAEMRRLRGNEYIYAKGAAVFSLLADGAVTAALERCIDGQWTAVLTVNAADGDGMRPVSGALTTAPEAGDKMRLKLSAADAIIGCVGLFEGFPGQEEVPVYGNYRFHPLPSDFGREALVTARPFAGRVGRKAFYSVREGKIGFPWDFSGSIDLEYQVKPTTVTETTDTDFALMLPEEAAEIIPCYAAALLLTDEDPRLSQFFMELYRERREGLRSPMKRSVINTLWR